MVIKLKTSLHLFNNVTSACGGVTINY